jgi:bacterioferritin-associated ferredoxin
MYVCMCNPFTDKDLEKALQDESVRKKTSAVYKACTGGEKPCCGTCICEIRDRVNKHNEETLALAAE